MVLLPIHENKNMSGWSGCAKSMQLYWNYLSYLFLGLRCHLAISVPIRSNIGGQYDDFIFLNLCIYINVKKTKQIV